MSYETRELRRNVVSTAQEIGERKMIKDFIFLHDDFLKIDSLFRKKDTYPTCLCFLRIV